MKWGSWMERRMDIEMMTNWNRVPMRCYSHRKDRAKKQVPVSLPSALIVVFFCHSCDLCLHLKHYLDDGAKLSSQTFLRLQTWLLWDAWHTKCSSSGFGSTTMRLFCVFLERFVIPGRQGAHNFDGDGRRYNIVVLLSDCILLVTALFHKLFN